MLYFVCISVMRDTEEYGRDLEKILHQYTNYVKPAFEEFCLPVCIPNIILGHANHSDF